MVSSVFDVPFYLVWWSDDHWWPLSNDHGFLECLNASQIQSGFSVEIIKISAMAFYTFKHRISCSWSMMTPLFAKRHFFGAFFFSQFAGIRGDSVPGLHFLLVRTRNPSICWKNIAINNTTVEKNKPQMICQWSYVVITHGMLEIPEIPPFCPMNFPFKWPWKWWIFQPCLMTQHDAWTGLDWTVAELSPLVGSWVMDSHGTYCCVCLFKKCRIIWSILVINGDW